jgi:L-threonylcarbamoyladenylate synthase
VGVDATNPDAVTKLLKYKNRPAGKPISVAVADMDAALQLIEENEQVRNIMQKFLPGPITVVGKSRGKVDKRLESETGTLGIRIPAYGPLLEILKQYGKPVTSTSANLAGERRPYNIQKDLLADLPQQKKDMIDLVIDMGELEHNPPSLVIDTTQTNKVFREGLITTEDIARGEVFLSSSVAETKKIAANFVENLKNEEALLFLHGELGAGKTQFSSGIGAALGVKEQISSPSFNLAQEYDFVDVEGKGRFYHLDLWRSEEKLGLQELGIELVPQRKDIVCIEWPDNLNRDNLPEISQFDVKILKTAENERRIIITRLT